MKTLERLKKYFATTSKEQQDKDWEEIKHLNEIDDGGTLEYMLKEEDGLRKGIKKKINNVSDAIQ